MRKSYLGNQVAVDMDAILDSEEHRALFSKMAAKKCSDCLKDCEKCTGDEKCKCDCKKEKHAHAAAKDKKEKKTKCTCPKDCDCRDKDGECTDCKCEKPKKSKKKAVEELIHSVLKLSEDCDNLGLSKTAASALKIANVLMIEAAGADTIEEMLKENPDLDVDVAVVKEAPSSEKKELYDPRLMALELLGEDEDEEDGDLMAQLEALEAAGREAGAEEVSALGLGMPKAEPMDEDITKDLGLEEIEAATAKVDSWLKKHGVDNELDVNADLGNLLTSEVKDVEDYLIDKNLNS